MIVYLRIELNKQKPYKMATEIITFGKYKGQQFSAVPYDYAIWQRTNNNWGFFAKWLENTRFNKRTNFNSSTSNDGHWMERKTDEGYIFYYNVSGKSTSDRKYYLTDLEGNYIKDLLTFGDCRVKQGAIDSDFIDWVTLTPSGKTIPGKMVVSPYFEHFQYSTYQVKNTAQC